ncbi:MAG: MBL fold metallo-hydrolase [Myxococcota bacterium]|nr:MBL fold metallo-hydrolase [Deltaproteobacteria bacterium]MDQ3336868.1 MBL fold metallo-hydrolase [Myxococcota bacterium]
MTIRAVHHINCATLCPVAGFLTGAQGFGRGHMVAHCLVVETERDGLVLIDTGFGTRDVEDKTGLSRTFKTLVGPTLSAEEPAIVQLPRLGYDPDDVRHIVVTHLDLDHAGGLGDFPHARVHLHSREHAAAMTRRHFKERERYLRAHWRHSPDWEVYTEDGDTWRGLPAITRLRGLDADVGLLPMHGHTRGHSAVIVRDKDRWLVHAGDAYFHRNSMNGSGAPVPVGFRAFEIATEMSTVQRKASLAALRHLRESHDDVAMFCAHDPVEYEAMRARVAARAAS